MTRRDWLGIVALAGVSSLGGWLIARNNQASAEPRPGQGAPVAGSSEAQTAMTNNARKAYFAAGCFWGVEAAFRRVPGVIATSVGYTGGSTDDPTYEEVCGDQTGHAEAVEVIYDPEKVSYDKLLEVFFSSHDPTQMNRQGPDVGRQYRSAVFYVDGGQRQAAEAHKAKLEKSGKYRRPIATEIGRASTFWMAEDYHQQYYEKRGIVSCPTH